MSQKLIVDTFKCIKYKFTFYKEFIEDFNKDSVKEYKLINEIDYLKELHKLYGDLPFLPTRMKIDKCEKLYVICMTRKQCNTHKHSEAGIESWTNTSESAQGNRVQSRSTAKAVHRYEHKTENKSQK